MLGARFLDDRQLNCRTKNTWSRLFASQQLNASILTDPTKRLSDRIIGVFLYERNAHSLYLDSVTQSFSLHP